MASNRYTLFTSNIFESHSLVLVQISCVSAKFALLERKITTRRSPPSPRHPSSCVCCWMYEKMLLLAGSAHRFTTPRARLEKGVRKIIWHRGSHGGDFLSPLSLSLYLRRCCCCCCVCVLVGGRGITLNRSNKTWPAPRKRIILSLTQIFQEFLRPGRLN